MGTRRLMECREAVQVKAGPHIIQPTETEKLLGRSINQNSKWQSHIQSGESSLTKQLTRRLNALKTVSVYATFKTRVSEANEIFMSVLIIYLIPLWGGCEDYLVRALQVLQNRAARQVTKMNWFTPTRRLLNQCGWLSIRQLIFYHSAVAIFRTRESRLPVYLNQKLVTGHRYPTRHSKTQGEESGPRVYLGA